MIEISKRLSASGAPVQAYLELAFELRQKRWLRTTLSSGEEASLRLPRGERLRDGDLFQASDGRVIAIVAAAEPVLHIECLDGRDLSRVAYHLGNRHVPVQLGIGFLRIQENPGLREMVRRLGATVTTTSAPFEPEPGAYANSPAHTAEPGASIHEYGSRGTGFNRGSRRAIQMKSSADVGLLRLLQLASPALPVGAYSYSQGLEAAITAGIVRDAPSAALWIGDVLEYSMARWEAPLCLRLIESWRVDDYPSVQRWNELFLAGRETAELRAETVQMGFSLARLLREIAAIDQPVLDHLSRLQDCAFPTAFALAVCLWQIDPSPALAAYLWSWLENQVMAAVKAVPLGQTGGQKILLALGDKLLAVAGHAAALTDDEIGSFAPALAILSSHHETQYSRLFRS